MQQTQQIIIKEHSNFRRHRRRDKGASKFTNCASFNLDNKLFMMDCAIIQSFIIYEWYMKYTRRRNKLIEQCGLLNFEKLTIFSRCSFTWNKYSKLFENNKSRSAGFFIVPLTCKNTDLCSPDLFLISGIYKHRNAFHILE